MKQSKPAKPYPGLRPFRKDEWSILYGRQRMIGEVVDRLGEHALVVVHGASGSGKSSLIRAGVLPFLEQELSRQGLTWRTASMSPGSSPLWNLATALARLHLNLEDEVQNVPLKIVQQIRDHLDEGIDAIKLIAESFALGVQSPVCILLDQFEELFRFAEDISRDEAELLIEFLCGLQKYKPSGVHAILTMRSEYLGDCAQFDGFAELVNDTQYLLPRMSRTDLLRAIWEPARSYGGDITRSLRARLLQEVAANKMAYRWSSMPLNASGIRQRHQPLTQTNPKASQKIQRLSFSMTKI